MKDKPTPLNEIKMNDGSHGLPKNPRFIRDERFRALCDSIRDNPEYMPARPIIVDENNVVLGGNIRLRGCRELKIDPLPAGWVQRVTGWSLEKKRRFIIMDNRGFGEDDKALLAEDWDIAELIAAGFDPATLENTVGGGEGQEPDEPDAGGAYQEQYGVIVVCGNQEEQERVYSELYGRGLNVRVVAT